MVVLLFQPISLVCRLSVMSIKMQCPSARCRNGAGTRVLLRPTSRTRHSGSRPSTRTVVQLVTQQVLRDKQNSITGYAKIPIVSTLVGSVCIGLLTRLGSCRNRFLTSIRNWISGVEFCGVSFVYWESRFQLLPQSIQLWICLPSELSLIWLLLANWVCGLISHTGRAACKQPIGTSSPGIAPW